MTKWLTVAVLMVSTAWAAPDWPPILGTVTNQAGGKIVFTNAFCKESRSRRIAYIKDVGGKISGMGCWEYSAKQFWVFWNDGDVFAYDLEAFEASPEFSKVLKEKEWVRS